MAKWKNVRLGDIVKIQQTTCAFGGDKVWLLNLDMIEQNTGKIIDYYYTNTFGNSTIAFDEEHVLYSKLRPNLNKVVCPNGKGFATSELLPLLPNKEYITKEYLAEYLRSSYFVEWAVSKTAGAKMPRLAPKELMNKSIPLPDLETQRKIAANLDKVTHTIDLCNAILEKLDLLVKSRFVEMFGDMSLNSNRWKQTSLGDACDVRDGTHDSPKYYLEGYPLVTSKNLTDGEIDFTDCSLITEEDYRKINQRSKVDIGDILMPMIGTVGNPVIVNVKAEFAIKNVALIKFREESPVINIFVKALLESDYFDRAVLSKVRGGTQKFISLGDIRKLEFSLPPIELQNQFAAFVEQTDKSKSAVKKLLEKAETLKKALMQEYFG